MNKLEKATSKILPILDSLDSTDDLVLLNETVREYVISRLKQREQELTTAQNEIKNKIEQLTTN